MPNGHKEDIDRLEKRITTLREALTNLNTDHDWGELNLIIRRPGFTTPAGSLRTIAKWKAFAPQIPHHC